MLKLHVLASGSKGNAAVVENAATGAGVLVDCGICKRDFLARCDEAGFDPARIEAVVVTHEHTDHVKGLGVVLRGLAKLGCAPTVHVSEACVRNSATLQEIADAHSVAPLAANDPVESADIRLTPFATSHDAAASFGFRIEDAADGDAIGFLTDSGIVPLATRAALSGVRILALESNHDAAMLKAGPYPVPVKQRIAGDSGHLSNAQAAGELAALISASRDAGLRGPEAVIAMHISQTNNDYVLLKHALEGALDEAGCEARVLCGYQSRLTSVS